MAKFEILSEIKEIETIASGRGVRISDHLNRVYGTGRWRKMKGRATVRLPDGTIGDAEIHWYEAHNLGRRDFKIKRLIR